MTRHDVAIVTVLPCIEVRDCIVLANLAWLDAHGYRLISTNREFVVGRSGDGFAVGLLADAGLTPATRAA
jgi:hypothetical protein